MKITLTESELKGIIRKALFGGGINRFKKKDLLHEREPFYLGEGIDVEY